MPTPDPNKNPLKLETVFPIAVWLRDQPWKLPWVRWFLIFALLPLAMTLFFNQAGDNLSSAAWFFGLYFAALWLMVLYFAMRPGKMEITPLAQIAVFTAFAGVFLVLLIQQVPPFSLLYQDAFQGGFVLRTLGFVLGVGVLEEAIKGLPVYLFVSRTKDNLTPLQFSFCGAVSGLAFGVSEAVSYSYKYSMHLRQGDFGFGTYIVVQLLRLITLPLLHACWSAIMGYFLGLAYRYKKPSKTLFIFGLGITALLHGLYDALGSTRMFGAFGSLGVATISLIVFISYVRTSNLISQQIEAQYKP